MSPFRASRTKLMFLSLALAALASHAQTVPTYHLVDLGANTRADHTNNRGEIAGASSSGPGLLRNGAWLSTANVGTIAALDDHGDLLESAWAGQIVYAPRGSNAITLPPFPGAIWASGTGVALGRVGGQVLGQDFIPACFVWTPETGYQTLTPSGVACAANGINAAGQVTGWHLNDIGATVAYVWQGGVFQDVPSLPGSDGGAQESEQGTGINRYGHVVFFARMKDGSYHAALFRGRRVFDAGPYNAGSPLAINDVDEIVGSNVQGDGWLWSAGVSTPLSQLVDVGPEWTNLQGSSINVGGVIVGNGQLAGVPHAFVLQPLAAR